MNCQPWKARAMLWRLWTFSFVFLWFPPAQTSWSICYGLILFWKIVNYRDFWRQPHHTMAVQCLGQRRWISIHQQWVLSYPLLGRKPSWVRNRLVWSLFVHLYWIRQLLWHAGCSGLFDFRSYGYRFGFQRMWMKALVSGQDLGRWRPACYRPAWIAYFRYLSCPRWIWSHWLVVPS